VPAPPIYVEILIRAPIEAVWERTQRPEVHVRWDLRFTDIKYLRRAHDAAPQEFRYATRLGFGFGIEGRGETLGQRSRPDGSRASSLRFWSDSPASLIREGSGYWRYIPTEEGVRFLTWYDYRVRFGRLGRVVDRVLFRPLIGWATAWSFDRLRLWLEEGVEPDISLQQTLAHFGARAALAICWIYQGFVPKLVVRDSGELDLLRRSGVTRGRERSILTIVGVGEIALGAAHLTRSAGVWACKASLVALPVLATGALKAQPTIYLRPFNPASLTVAMGALAGSALLTRRRLPSARACIRTQPR
jgi:hypothetical protein